VRKPINADVMTVDGVFYCAKYAGEQFKKQGKGNLIITSSISAHIVNVPVDQPVSTYSPNNCMLFLTDCPRSTTPQRQLSLT
jgi:NAD(P)-dependent dehydrogenase (short-subunit alcohol dehydrogenase family)